MDHLLERVDALEQQVRRMQARMIVAMWLLMLASSSLWAQTYTMPALGNFVPRAINADGVIAGIGMLNDERHSFLLTPVILPPSPPTVTLVLNQTTFDPGETLYIGVHATNPGPDVAVDMYFGAILPDENTMVFVTAMGYEVLSLDQEVDAWPPYVPDVVLPQGLDVTLNPLVSHTFTASDADGTYQLFMFFTPPGALADGSVEDGEVLALAVEPVQFSPAGLFTNQ